MSKTIAIIIIIASVLLSVAIAFFLKFSSFNSIAILTIGNIALLNFLYSNFIKPYTKSYVEEKAKNKAELEDIGKITRENQKVLQEFKDDLGSEIFIEKQIGYIEKFWFEFSDLHNKLYRKFATFLLNTQNGQVLDVANAAEFTKATKREFAEKMYRMRGFKIFLTKETNLIFERYFSYLKNDLILDMVIFDGDNPETNNLELIFTELFNSIRNDISNIMSREINIQEYFKQE